MLATHNKAQARIDRIEISAPKLYVESEFIDDDGRDGGEFLAFSWQRATFALRVRKPDASASRMKEQKPQREVGGMCRGFCLQLTPVPVAKVRLRSN
jgi:hypothetical protein